MKAVIWTDLDKIEVGDAPKPVPGEKEVLVRVKAASLCKTDAIMIEHGILDIEPPVIIGHEASGVVEELGAGVEGLAVGQLVALDPPVPCRRCRVCRSGLRHMCPNTRHIGAHIPGSLAEYVTIDYRNAYPVPEGVSVLAASLAEPFAVCLEALAQAGGVEGKSISILGDGPFGLIMARLARSEGAAKVLMFGHHASRMERLKGYDVLTHDSHTVDVGESIREHTGEYGAQIIVDATGSATLVGQAVHWLSPRGKLVLFAPAGTSVPVDLETVHFRELSLVGACRSLDMFPRALETIGADSERTEALITHQIPIERVEEGFALIEHAKDEVIKIAVVFGDTVA